MPSVIASCSYFMFGRYLWEACTFLREHGEAGDPEDVCGKLGGGRKVGCGQDGLCERMKKMKKEIK